MRGLPIDQDTIIHFVGIGGIGMSGIAEVLHNLGYVVQGSDLAVNNNINRLSDLGVNVMIGHAEENLGSAAVVVISSAIKLGNPELDAARKRLTPVVRRAEMLGELMRFKWAIAVGGTHGKTTTTSLVAALLEEAEMDPTVINGGIINAWGTNARLGSSEWMVAEADESDGTFVKLPSTITVVTNIDSEHMDYFGSFDHLKDAFVSFIEQIPFYGFAALCIDDAGVQAIIPRVSDRRVITYGVTPQADIRVADINTSADGSNFDIIITDRKSGDERIIDKLYLPMVGNHNILNSAAAISIAIELGLTDDVIRKGLGGFTGVKRRFTKTGVVDGITIIDDYGHHPAEILAVVNAARVTTAEGRVMAVVQPHRYSRLRDLFEDFCTCFNDADIVVVADIYAAGEMPIEGVTQASLIEGLRAHGHRMVIPLEHPDDLTVIVNEHMNSGDLVVCLGAGNITVWANDLPSNLANLRASMAKGS
ncbi:MAG TPA: UDP-N-acetylmuramate--L-alanine ligase [Rhodospirillales bacterium]|nr:UDP-N-acetylmuramate--L-alanine ligase [Rhodospirillales bacterium]HIL76992.1 UDP-N-acetylmuramate--L-alanine ligase [Rhodospirillales bacterium]